MRIAFCFLVVAFFTAQPAAANPVAPASFVPEIGPYGSFAVFFDTAGMPGVGEAAAADYLRPDGRRLGALLATTTEPFYDTEFVTAAFAEGTITTRSSRVMAGGTFDVFTIVHDGGSEVFAIGFTVSVDGSRSIVDGTAPHTFPAGGNAFHVVAWAESEEAAALLIGSSLDLISAEQPLGFAQETPTAESLLAATSASPNPFVKSCDINFTLRGVATVDLAAFDALGRRVAVLATGNLEQGAHTFPFDAASIPAGVYIARLLVDGHMSTRRITRMR